MVGRITKYYRISEVAENSGIPKTTIDYWARMQLLPVEKTTISGRQFPETVFGFIDRIEKLKSAGKTIEEIRRIFTKER